MSSERPSLIQRAISTAAVAVDHATKLAREWVDEKEADSKRLEYLDQNYTRIQDVYGRMSNEDGNGTIREAIDFFMERDGKVPGG